MVLRHKGLLLLLFTGALGALAPLPSVSASDGKAKPLRASDALWGADPLRLSLQQRSRYEHLDNDFRRGATGTSAGVALRTQLAAELTLAPALVGLELQDARMVFPTDATTYNTTLEDPLDILQAYVGLQLPDLFQEGAAFQVRVGRMTVDLDGRRLMARNAYRNTINAFTGLDVQWTSAEGHALRAFATMPVTRRPSDAEELRDHRVRMDTESLDTVFWGLHAESPEWGERLRAALYLLGLREQDAVDLPTRDRRLYTLGVRLVRPAETGALDYELESALQLGLQRASAAADDRRDLDHTAYFTHFHVGYSLPGSLRLRAVLVHDYASGDSDPNDDLSGRFDTLYGARRFEFGPTGLFGAIARANLNSPGMRLEIAPHADVDGFLAYRGVWLASATDAWTTSGLQDPSGSAGRFVGHQVEARVRVRPLPGNVALDVGVAHLVLGRFAKTTAGPGFLGNPLYLYSELTLEL